MSDATPVEAAKATSEETAVPAAPKPTPPAAPSSSPARDEPDWKAEARKWEQRAKENRERLSPLEAQMAALKNLFADKPSEDGDTDIVQRVARIEHAATVDRVARRHGISADDDVEFLRTARDEATMTRLAQRLTQAAAPQTPTPPTSPAPDPSQASAPLTEQAAADAAYKAFFPDSKG